MDCVLTLISSHLNIYGMKINVQAIVSMVQVCYDDATIQYLIVTINDNLYVASDIIGIENGLLCFKIDHDLTYYENSKRESISN